MRPRKEDIAKQKLDIAEAMKKTEEAMKQSAEQINKVQAAIQQVSGSLPRRIQAGPSGSGGGGGFGGSSYTYNITASSGGGSTPTNATPARVKDIMKEPPTWEAVMAASMAQYEVGRLNEARFLLDYAAEIRAAEEVQEAKFEQIRQKEAGDAG